MTRPTWTGQYREYAAWVAETRHRQAGWDLPGASPHLPWCEVAATGCPGGPWTLQPDGPAVVCRHKHYHPRAGPAGQATTADLP